MSTTGAIDPSGPSHLWRWVRSQTQSLSGLRDLILVVAGACYGVGYLVWSVHAWLRNLGHLPALRFQYFTAGAIPILFVLALYGLLWGLFRLRRVIASWTDEQRGFRWLVRRGILYLAVASAAVFFITSLDWIEAMNVAWMDNLQKQSLIAVYISSFLMPPTAKPNRQNLSRWWRCVYHVTSINFLRWLSAGYVVVLAVIGACLGLFWFILLAYPQIPQELGGVHPRGAVIYFSPESRVAPEVLALLITPVARTTEEPQREAPAPGREGVPPRTLIEETGRPQAPTIIEIDVYFADSNLLLVKPVGEERRFRSPTYEIRRQSVAAISWQ